MAASVDRLASQCVPAEEAFRVLGIDRTTGYRAIKDNTFPLPVVRVGRLLKVPTRALRQLLLLDEPYDGEIEP
jgi:predicted DNA-binding transcriptional regulator AlpA